MTNRNGFSTKKKSIELKITTVLYKFASMCFELALMAYIRYTLWACMVKILKTPFNQGAKHG